MTVLLDIALAILVLAAAFLLFGVTKQLIAETKKDDDTLNK